MKRKISLSCMFGLAFNCGILLQVENENEPFHFLPLLLTTIGRKMSAPSRKLTTRASNAKKHPGIPDQTKKKRSPVQMAALRASEKVTNDAKAAAALAAPAIIAGIEDSMATDDKDSEKNAAQPATAEITRHQRPIRRTHTFADLGRGLEVEVAQNGLSQIVVTHPFLNAGQ